ncbi:MAG: hypothetical protein DBX59_04115 [Bacillota bacterium]|nr:MAG: hypothetical protein DBX59_04115 [Bacillota bacterium]
MFDMIKHYGFIDDTQLNEYSDIIGKRLEIPAQSSGNKTELIVKGVYQNAPAAKYDVLKEDATNDLSQEYQYIVLESGIYNTVLVSDGFYDANVQLLSYQNESAVDYGFYSLHQSYLVGPTEIAQEWDEQEFKRSLFRALDLTSDTPVKPKIHFYGGTKTELADGEIVCSIEMISSYYERLVYEKMRDLEMQGDYDAARVYQDEMYKNLSFLNYGYYSVRNDDGYEERVKPTEQDYAAAFEEIEKLDEEYGWNRMMKIEDANSGQTYKTFKLAGFIYGARDCSDAAYFSPSDFKDILAMSGTTELSRYYQKSKYVAPADAVYNKIVVASPDRAGLKAILDGEKVVDETDDTFYALESDISNSLTMINDTIEMLSTVFLWVGVVMAVFAMLLLFNFISVSITYKKREIGILRAVGARSTDVFKIFYSESAIIAIICLVLSFVTSFIVCGVLNNMLAEGLRVAIFVFGPYSWLIMLGIAIVTSLIATFLPVYGIAKKKPVESIRSL